MRLSYPPRKFIAHDTPGVCSFYGIIHLGVVQHVTRWASSSPSEGRECEVQWSDGRREEEKT